MVTKVDPKMLEQRLIKDAGLAGNTLSFVGSDNFVMGYNLAAMPCAQRIPTLRAQMDLIHAYIAAHP